MALPPRQPHTGAQSPGLRPARRALRKLNNPALLEPLSWVLWLVAVAAFALWTLHSYQAPAKPAWIGMTIHTTVFAIWGLIIREWAALRWRERPPRNK
ncbi:hypothetical protein SE17_24415 [Kouleothrix aurantiaca]|jgi:hypothetical protein|uniref:Uncharacterized protein n=1 Tax=Kouleothrix aurantiaca TaxID=186479 RepID=A0A0P9DLL5_9CHLR|nr:hypothetical protein SE17_24415 [Kouleothrix aurantiaca]